MKPAHFAAAFAFTILVAGGIAAQDRHEGQFTDHDRQVAETYYSQHRSHPPAGFRAKDRLTTDVDARLRAGERYDRDLERRAYSIPRGLRHDLAPPPSHHKYVTIGGHIVLVDTNRHVIRDVIRLGDH